MAINGQWLGTYTGTSTGSITVNIDKDEESYVGSAYLFDSKYPQLPHTFGYFGFPISVAEKDFSFRVEGLQTIVNGNAAAWETVKSKFPGVEFSKYADVKGSCDSEVLKLSWVSDIGATGNATMPRSQADKSSELVVLEMNWESYKQYVSQLLSKRYLFRGQDEPWRLRTSFHRSGRADMHRFLGRDMSALHKHLSARTKHIFNLSVGDENGAFLNLVQHHGYPTPILDWTYSPYVAAFFAYRWISNEKAALNPSKKVRIFQFDQDQWKKSYEQLNTLVTPALHVSILEFIAMENERMIPQQAASLVTNIDDIESYLKSKETDTKKYLSAIALPWGERKTVFRELSYMGISAGSLFPGLDGACEELKERNFQ